MDANAFPKTVRRLQRAEGYIELELPERALAELNSIAETGPFEAAISLLRGEALKVQKRYGEAVEPLKRAATMIPVPLNRRAWVSLSECYRQSGREELAELADLAGNMETHHVETAPSIRIAVIPLEIAPQALKDLVRQLMNEETGEQVGDNFESND